MTVADIVIRVQTDRKSVPTKNERVVCGRDVLSHSVSVWSEQI